MIRRDMLIGPQYTPLWQRVLAVLIPVLSLFVAFVLDAVPLTTLAWSLVVPDFLAPSLFFWCVHRPNQVPVAYVFAVGLGADMLHGTPLGSQAAAYMALALLAKSQASQLAPLGPLFHWGIFALTMTGFALIKFLIAVVATPSVFDHSLIPAILQALQLVLTTIAAYLPIHLVLGGLRRLFFPLRPAETQD